MSPVVRLRHLYLTSGLGLRIFRPLHFCCTVYVRVFRAIYRETERYRETSGFYTSVLQEGNCRLQSIAHITIGLLEFVSFNRLLSNNTIHTWLNTENISHLNSTTLLWNISERNSTVLLLKYFAAKFDYFLQKYFPKRLTAVVQL
jgi:hypothetical protein